VTVTAEMQFNIRRTFRLPSMCIVEFNTKPSTI